MINDPKPQLEPNQQNVLQEIPLELISTSLESIYAKSDKSKNQEIISPKAKNISFSDFLNNTTFLLYTKLSNTQFFHKRFKRNIEYLNKLITKMGKISYIEIQDEKKEKINKLAYLSILIIKNNIENKSNGFNKKILKILLLLIYLDILTINTFCNILECFINSTKNIIISNNIIIENEHSFRHTGFAIIYDLLESLITLPLELINDKKNIQLVDQIISIFEENIVTIPIENINLSKISIWLKLLGTKVTDLQNKESPIYSKLTPFLVKIYQNKFPLTYLYKNIFESCAINFNYYSNSLDFLSNLFTKEQEIRINKGFKIKNGFYIFNNKPLVLNGTNFTLHKLNEYSLIFSFKLLNIPKSNEEIGLINIINKDKKEIFKAFIDKNKFINIKSKKSEWKTEIVIEPNTNYFMCLSQEKKVLDLFVNDIRENKNAWIEREKHNIYLHNVNNKMNLPEFDKVMTFEFGKSNFNGIFGELLIINKVIKEKITKVKEVKEVIIEKEKKDKGKEKKEKVKDKDKDKDKKKEKEKEEKVKKEINDIEHLFNLKENYADVLSSNNNRYELIESNNKFYQDNDDVKFFSCFEYQIHLKILTENVNRFLSHKSYYTIKPYGKLQYEGANSNSNKKDEIINLKTYSLSYSILNFLTGKGIEYLIFQLYNIINSCKTNIEINFFLYKTMKIFYEIVLLSNDYLIHIKEKKMKIKEKVTIFLLSLITVINTKKRQIILDENIRQILFKFCEIAKDKNLLCYVNMFLSILFDIKLFYRNNMSHYGDLFDNMIYFLDKFEKEKDYLLFNRELFYKILSFDHILETKEMKHKKYMKMISTCLILKDSQKNEKDIIKAKTATVTQLINYIKLIKNEMKLYHYLKIIYINCNNIQECLKDSNDFAYYIKIKMDKIDGNHCKYCKNIQLLCYLLFYEVFVNKCNESEDERVFHYEPYGFMKSPNYNFIKCIFIQYYKIENEQKMHYFKSSDIHANEMDFFKQFYSKDDNEAIDIISLANYSSFVPKLNAIISYLNFLYKEHINSNNEEMISLIKRSVNLILSFLKEVFDIYNKDIATHIDNNTTDNIINEKFKFIKDLLVSEGIFSFYVIYIHLFNDQALKDLNSYIQLSINKIYNPFYINLLSNSVSLNNDIDMNYHYKSQVLEKIIIEILNNSHKKDIVLIQNCIIILITIYQNIFTNLYLLIEPQIESSIITFIRFLLDNHFLYSKLIFNIHSLNKTNEKDLMHDQSFSGLSSKNLGVNISYSKKKHKAVNTKNYKFLSEILLDFLFKLYDNIDSKNKPTYLALFNKYLKGQDKHSVFYYLDEAFLLDNTNKNNPNNIPIVNNISSSLVNCVDIKMFNELNIKTNYFNSEVVYDVLHSLFFFLYFYSKKCTNIHEEIHIENNDNNKENMSELINSIVEILFNDCSSLFQTQLKKIKKLKSKDVIMNEYFYKMYYCLVEIFIKKSKDNNFSLNDFDLLYENLMNKQEILNAKRRESFLEETHSGIFSDRKESINHFFSKISSKNNKKKLSSSAAIAKLDKDKTKKSTSVKKRPRSLEFKNIHIIKERIKKHIFKGEEKPNLKKTNSSKSKKNISTINNNNSNNNNSNSSSIIDDKTKAEEGDNSMNKKIISQNTENSSESDKDDSMINESEGLSHNNNNNYPSGRQDSLDLKDIIHQRAISSNIICKCNTVIGINVDKTTSNRKESFYNNNTKMDNNNVNNQSSLSPIPEDPIKKLHSDTINPRITIQSEVSFNEGETEESESAYLQKKLTEIDPPYLHYKNNFGKTELKVTRLLFDPKQMFLFRTFCFTFRKFIFYNKKFKKLRNAFKISYKNVSLEHSLPQEEEYTLDYPTKLKNFTCQEYYRPFLKPCLNYFKHELFNNSHPFITKEIINKNIEDEEKINYMEFERIILIDRKNKKKSKKVVCENITNKGSIFGYIYFNHSFMIFEDTSEEDKRLKYDPNDRKCLFFLYSSDKADRIANKKKYIIMYYDDIKEILIRRFCFTYIAYEIFMKDNKTYLFNFFNKSNLEIFSDLFKENTEKYKKESFNNNSPLDFNIINEPRIYFEKADYKSKYVKNEITNFDYLLLVNKFSSRSYNDINQYVIFPLLYMDVNKTKMRDLSKPICLNKTITEEDQIKYRNNYETMGYHFNIHYSTMAYVIFYNMRLIPFTYCQIKFQSGHFDAPARMFTSLANLLYVFSVSDENRELCPELFHSYESLLNLNYNGFGFVTTDKKQIHHFNTSQNCGIVEFIIKSRQLLETKEVSGWINNIYGNKQFIDSPDVLNTFPDYTYEQYNDFEKERDEYVRKKLPQADFVKEIKSKIELLSLGMTPVQLFKNPHPIKDINKTSIKNEITEKIGFSPMLRKRSLHRTINNTMKTFINGISEKYQFLTNNNNNDSLKFIFINKTKINIFNPYIDLDRSSQPIKLEIDDVKIIKLKPLKNLLVELFTGFYCMCRFIDRTIKIYSEKNKFSIKWSCIVTSLEFYSYNRTTSNDPHIERHINKIFMGDEEGNLSLIQIEIDHFVEKKIYQIKSLNVNKLVKAHYSFINGLLYNERLNIIISSCGEGFITINNSYSFDVLNIIHLDNYNNIYNLQLSIYDLLYIHCYDNKTKEWNIYCYTLNGLKITMLNSKKEFINYFIDKDYLSVVYPDKSIHVYNCYDLKERTNDICESDCIMESKKEKVLHCSFCPKMNKIIVIFNKDIIAQDLPYKNLNSEK